MGRQAVHAQVRAASAHHWRPLSAHCTDVVPQMRQRALCDAAASGCARMHVLPRKRSQPCGVAHVSICTTLAQAMTAATPVQRPRRLFNRQAGAGAANHLISFSFSFSFSCAAPASWRLRASCCQPRKKQEAARRRPRFYSAGERDRRQKNKRTPNEALRPGSITSSLRKEVCTRASWLVRLLPSRNTSHAVLPWSM